MVEKKYFLVQILRIKILMYLHVLGFIELENHVFSGWSAYVCILATVSMYMCVSVNCKTKNEKKKEKKERKKKFKTNFSRNSKFGILHLLQLIKTG